MHIFIDLDDTILDFLKAEEVALSKTLEHFNIPPTKETIQLYSKINDSLWKKLETGEMTREQILLKRFEMLFQELNAQGDCSLVNDKYKENLSQGHWFIDGAEELLQSLYKKHNLYIVSNGTTSVQKGRIKSANIEKYFDGIFLSQDIGYNKPNVKFFEKCFEKIQDFDKNNAIILGDSVSSDIKGGINAGIKTCLFDPRNKFSGDIKPDYIIQKLSEFSDIV